MRSITMIGMGLSALLFCGLGCEESKPVPPTKAPTVKATAKASTAKTGATKTAAAKPTAAPTASASAAAADKPAIREVPPDEWKSVVGPKLKTGMVVAFKVYEGWPKPKSLFVVTKEGGNYKAHVFDDRVYPTGNLGPSDNLHSVNAVGFFDVDADGKDDAVIISAFGEKGATTRHNSLLKWTGTSLEHMKALEKKLEPKDTLDEIKKLVAK